MVLDFMISALHCRTFFFTCFLSLNVVHLQTVMLTLQVLDDATEAVAVGGDDNVLSRLDYRGDDVIPERQGAGNGVLQ